MRFLCATKNSPPEAVDKYCSQSARKSCDEIHIIVNLSQKYEGDLGY